MLWTQIALERELGTCIPTVLQGYFKTILLNAVRIWWNYNSGADAATGAGASAGAGAGAGAADDSATWAGAGAKIKINLFVRA